MGRGLLSASPAPRAGCRRSRRPHVRSSVLSGFPGGPHQIPALRNGFRRRLGNRATFASTAYKGYHASRDLHDQAFGCNCTCRFETFEWYKTVDMSTSPLGATTLPCNIRMTHGSKYDPAQVASRRRTERKNTGTALH
jgi:hypothetical protein